jgi:fatty acid desaturase (delta-4 desaturase)
MAPDADKLRLRKPSLGGSYLHGSADVDDGAATVERNSTLKGLQGNEICIDGVIYDLTSFDHPGGESIRVFGGNDATTQYKMIHPYHTSKHLDKMKVVGRVPDYVSQYKWDTPFEREIKREVFKIVNRGKEFGTIGYFARALVYVVIFFYLQYQWIQETTYSLAIMYGVSMALIGLNVQHDANHGAASKKVWINDLLGLGADAIGGSKWLWMEKHWTVRANDVHKSNHLSNCLL